MWLDIAMIVFAVTAANHMGLIDAIEKAIGCKIPIVNCCKCGTFWATLIYCFFKGVEIDIFMVVAISFVAALTAIWLELGMGAIDKLYERIYERIYDTSTVTKADGDKGNSKAATSDNTEDTLP